MEAGKGERNASLSVTRNDFWTKSNQRQTKEWLRINQSPFPYLYDDITFLKEKWRTKVNNAPALIPERRPSVDNEGLKKISPDCLALVLFNNISVLRSQLRPKLKGSLDHSELLFFTNKKTLLQRNVFCIAIIIINVICVTFKWTYFKVARPIY